LSIEEEAYNFELKICAILHLGLKGVQRKASGRERYEKDADIKHLLFLVLATTPPNDPDAQRNSNWRYLESIGSIKSWTPLIY